jgi:uncharacterized protein (UPF0332 family)
LRFDPSDFLRLAERLSLDQNYSEVVEARLRTSIGRSYYAVLLVLRETIRRKIEAEASEAVLHMFEEVTSSHLVHGFIRRMVSEVDTYLSKLFNRLQMLRRVADYDIHRRIDNRDCEEAIASAKEILSSIKPRLSQYDVSEISRIVAEYYTMLRSPRSSFQRKQLHKP